MRDKKGLVNLFQPILIFLLNDFSVCSWTNIPRICFICINMHRECKIITYADNNIIKCNASLIT